MRGVPRRQRGARACSGGWRGEFVASGVHALEVLALDAGDHALPDRQRARRGFGAGHLGERSEGANNVVVFSPSSCRRGAKLRPRRAGCWAGATKETRADAFVNERRASA